MIDNFLLLVYLLNVVMFRPIRNSLKARQAKIQAEEAAIGQFTEQVDGLNQQMKDQVAAARRQGAGEREALKQQGAQAEASLLEQVKKEVDAEWAQVEQKIKADMAKARDALSVQAEGFAQMLAAKILGRELA
jgi:F-type H+-transporting ATPase subunit b